MGGHAFPDTSPLDAARAERAIAALRALTGWQLEPAGSLGHKPLIPDLDLVVADAEFALEQIAALGQVRKYGQGGAGLRFPFEGQVHQVDFFPATSLEWGRFTRAGAKDSGSGRALLLKAAAATLEEPGIDFVHWQGDRAVVRAGRTLDQRSGLRRIFQLSTRRDGRPGLLAVPRTVDRSEFEATTRLRVPNVPTIADPKKVLRLILGEEAPDGVDESEASLAEFIRSSFGPTRLRRLRAKLRERGRVIAALEPTPQAELPGLSELQASDAEIGTLAHVHLAGAGARRAQAGEKLIRAARAARAATWARIGAKLGGIPRGARGDIARVEAAIRAALGGGGSAEDVARAIAGRPELGQRDGASELARRIVVARPRR